MRLLAFLLLCSQAFATSVCVRTVDQQRQYDGSVVQSVGYGTAVVIDEDDNHPNRWIAITARHVLKGATERNTSIGIGEDWVPVRSFHAFKGDEDAAFVVFDCPRRFKLPALTMDDPDQGQSVTWSGYSGGNKFEKFTATVETVSEVGVARGEVRPRQGQSGGGVYSRGRLCGVVSGFKTDTGELIYTPMCRIQRRCYQQWGFGIGIGIGGGHVVPPPPVVQPTPRPTKPPAEVEPDVAPPPPTEDLKPTPIEKPAEKPTADIQQQLNELRELIKSLPGCNCLNKDKSKPSASIGPPCRCGDGCKGKCGDGCKCDLAAELAKVKVPIRVQILKPDGSIYDEETFPHGTPLKLKLSPVKK